MESTDERHDRHDASAALAAADDVRERLAGSLRLPAPLQAALAIALMAQLTTAAYGISAQTATGLGVVLAGAVTWLAVAVPALHRFRRVNGVRVDGLTSQVLLGPSGSSTVAYLAALGAATWAAFESRWWLVAVAAVAGGVAYAFGSAQWWRTYRRDPGLYSTGASPRVIGALSVLGAVGFVVLMVIG